MQMLPLTALVAGAIGAGAAILLGGCSDKCREYSAYTCDQIQKANYNVYFYYPDNREEFLGETQGLDSCGGIAHAYANNHDMSQAEWGYVCCMIAG
jgi:predicted CoA-binding protein